MSGAVATHDPTLYNEDLAAIPAERRTWTTYNYASLWVAMSVCIPTYMLASGLIAGGMSWKQALLIAVPSVALSYCGFVQLGVPLPRGPLPF